MLTITATHSGHKATPGDRNIDLTRTLSYFRYKCNSQNMITLPGGHTEIEQASEDKRLSRDKSMNVDVNLKQ